MNLSFCKLNGAMLILCCTTLQETIEEMYFVSFAASKLLIEKMRMTAVAVSKQITRDGRDTQFLR